ncbi:SH3 domain-containing protein [Streptococcus didelphis]|uniref:SH3 domain-containing protein n=1 Tax=Streptococcus didelphis TaxID=102886 RepID=UPI0027D31E7A|nr:SH3 domain-containing protein [Streptococcus didelphis]WMB29501.1 SH3 domain-containing protein [Streptococcus didelphis]
MGADYWGMYLRQCTSFVAFRLSKINGFTLPAGYGNADTWGHIARQQGYRVDKKATVGSVAWFDKNINNAHSLYGHVAWVAEVNGDQVILEEYNYNAGQGPEKYHKRQIHKNQVSGFIHFKDLNQDSNPTSSHQLSQTKLLPNKGSYYFKKSLPIKAKPILKEKDITYYQTGQIVYYDQTLIDDGYQWISYIGYSGNRRYIPIEKIRESKKPETFHAGQEVTFTGPFQVSQNHGWMISSNQLAGGPASQLNWLDPGPALETTKNGQKSGDQVLLPGDYFTIPGKYKILQVHQTSKGLLIQIGQRQTWVSMDQVKAVQ